MKVNLVFIIALCSSVLNGQKIQQELGEIITTKQNRLELQSLLSPDLYAMLAAQSPENKELLKGVVSAKEIKMYATGHPDKLKLNSNLGINRRSCYQ